MNTFRTLNADEIEVRVKQVGEKGAVALLYKTARTDMDILDEIIGADRWSCDYREIKGNLFCGIAVDGLTKWDCGIESRADDDGNEKKGEASDAFKRAGFRWGIGRELYTAPFIFLFTKTEKDKDGKFKLSGFPTFSVQSIGYDEKRRIQSLVIVEDKTGKVVFGYPKDLKVEEPEPADDPAKIALERSQIFKLGVLKGMDEQATRMRAEAYIEHRAKKFVAFDDMTMQQLKDVKQAVNKLKNA